MVRLLTIGLLALASTGCGTLEYLSQAAYGQRDIVFRTRPLADAIADPNVPERTRRLLAEVPAIKRFGERNGLRATRNYEGYADLRRRQVVWVVSACDPLRFRSKVWHFPIAGDVPYLGWFHRRDADRYADELRRDEQLDVDVRGSAAYSTLGWFRDPVLSTMLPDDDSALGELTETVLHESLHATMYVKGQTSWNESVANFVGGYLAGRYLAETRGPQAKETLGYLGLEQYAERRAARMHRAYEELATLYASDRSPDEKLAEKARVLARLTAEIHPSHPINNATLAQFKSYNTGEAELTALLAACSGDFARFLALLAGVDASAFGEPQQRDLGAITKPLERRCSAP